MCPGWKSLTALAPSCQPGIQDRSALTHVLIIMMVIVVGTVIIGRKKEKSMPLAVITGACVP